MSRTSIIELAIFALFNYAVLSLPVGRQNPGKYLAFIWALGFLVALSVPEHVLSTSPTIASFVRIVNYLFPVERMAAKAALQDVSTAYYAVTLFAFPFACRMISHRIRERPKQNLFHMKRADFRFQDYVAPLLYTVFFVPSFLIWWFWYGGQDTRFFDAGSSRWALGLFGMYLQVTVAALATMSFLSIKKIVLGYCWKR